MLKHKALIFLKKLPEIPLIKKSNPKLLLPRDLNSVQNPQKSKDVRKAPLKHHFYLRNRKNFHFTFGYSKWIFSIWLHKSKIWHKNESKSRYLNLKLQIYNLEFHKSCETLFSREGGLLMLLPTLILNFNFCNQNDIISVLYIQMKL